MVHANHTLQRKLEMFVGQKHKCWFCGRFCWIKSGNKRIDTQFTTEHIYPRSCGGNHHPENVIGCCHRCNQKRDAEFAVAERKAVIVVRKHYATDLRALNRIIGRESEQARLSARNQLGKTRLVERAVINSKRKQKNLL